MNYFQLQQNRLPIGSGIVEAACKNLISALMKKSGMRWNINGGQAVLVTSVSNFKQSLGVFLDILR